MVMKRLLLAAVMCAAYAGSAAAQEGNSPSCGSFTVVGAVESRAFVDLGDTGITAGDQRVGRYNLFDSDGEELGVMHFAGVLMPPWQAAESPMMTTLHFRFADGAVVTTSVVGLPNPADVSVGPDLNLQYAVTGGTGEFANASGTLQTRSLDDGRREMTFELNCGG